MPYISNPPQANIIYANGFGAELATDLLPETSCSPPLSPSPPVTPLLSTQGRELITVSAKQKTSLADESLSPLWRSFSKEAGHLPQPPERAALSLRKGGDGCSAPAQGKALVCGQRGGGAGPGCQQLISCRGRDRILALELKAAFREFVVS